MAGAMVRSLLEDSALLSGLVTPEQLSEAISAVARVTEGPSGPTVTVSEDRLAQQLVKMGLVTAYQTEQLRSGRTKLTLGPYLVTDWIAQGGMGQVFKAVHQMMGREVAIKVLPYGRSTPQAIANFTREIRAQAKLDHPNLVRAYDAGHDGNVYFLVTEYVSGADLRRLVRSRGPLSMQQAASVISQAAHGMAHAHRRGLVHRDVKPGNILVTPEGQAKVSDLGLAGWLGSDTNDPHLGRTVGTADYLSPEQIKSPGDVTPLSDLYSLGCTLYYAVTGKVPYPGGSTQDKARRHCESTPWHPRRFSSEITEDFADIIADMMEKDPQQRIQSALEVAARLEPWVSDAFPIAAHQLAKSFWMPPPVPSGSEDSQAGLSDTDDGSAGSALSGSRGHESANDISHGSDTNPSAAQRTLPLFEWERVPVPPPPLPEQLPASPLKSILITLAVAVPIAMLLGALLALVAFLMMR
jgi:serine/threonine protein kinase